MIIMQFNFVIVCSSRLNPLIGSNWLNIRVKNLFEETRRELERFIYSSRAEIFLALDIRLGTILLGDTIGLKVVSMPGR